VELRVEMAPQPPFGILGADIDQVDASALADEGPAASDAALAEAIKKLLGQKAAKGEFSGTVLLAREGRPFCHEAVGLADREVGAPNRPDTKFNLGSINKIFTQVAIGQLLEAGKIRLDDTISKHLPDYPAEPGNRITIRQLVAMTSGLGDFFGERFEAMPKTRLRSLRDYLPLFVDQPLRFEPGKGREYSNAGYVVLGLIVEAASGQSYYDYVREKIFTPAGMADTDSFAIDAEVPNRATGYTREGQPDSPARSNRELLPARGSSAGGGYSTAPDLLRFAEALCADRLLSPAYTDWVFGRGEQDPIPDASLPRGRRRDLGTGWAGGTAGVNAVLDLELGRGYTIVVMANQDPPAAERLAEQIRRQLPAKR
jgi:D-alanyl-D-alanine carboxypeptidase